MGILDKTWAHPLIKLSGTTESFNPKKNNLSYIIVDDRLILNKTPSDAVNPKRPRPYDETNWSSWRRACHSHVIQNVSDFPSTSYVLDLGAGRSPFRNTVNVRFQNILSIDFSPFELVDIVADISGILPFQDYSFELIIFSNVLEHMPNPDQTLQECHRVLRPGGKIVTQTPFLLPLHETPYDYNRLTSHGLHVFFERAGFQKVSVEMLSDTYDVLHSLHGHFFDNVLKQQKNIFHRYSTRVARKFFSTILKMLQKRYSANIIDSPKGYGTVAYKQA